MASAFSVILVLGLAAPAIGAPPAVGVPTAEQPSGGRDFVGASEPGVPPPVLPPATIDAEALYQQGEEAYWLGDFSTAVNKFEAAYSASRLPALLYNVGLAYLRRFEISADPLDLQRARAVLRNYSIELEKDPSLGQAENVPKLLGQIDELLAKTEAPEPSKSAAIDTCPELPPAPAPVAPPRTRRAGLALMGVSSFVLAGGVASALSLAFMGQRFRGQLAQLQADPMTAACAGVSSAACDVHAQRIDLTVANGRAANLMAGAVGGGLTALGAAGLIVGGVLFKGSTRAAGSRASLKVGPSLGGVVLGGNF